MKTNYFTELNMLDVSEHVEKKGQFSYLSWAWAVEQLGKVHPEATWEVHEYDNAPFMSTTCGYFVKVSVTIDDVVKTQIHPVLDNRNRPVAKPDAFHINTSIQRCLVKAIALHGLGLYIYSGEDLPTDAPPFTKAQKEIFDTLLEADDDLAFWYSQATLDDNVKVALYNSFPKGKITALKKQARDRESKGSILFAELRDAMQEHIENSDKEGLTEIGNELGEAKAMAFHQLPADIQQKAKEL